jgi:hypothetical protein
LPVRIQVDDERISGFPLIEEFGHGLRLHVAHVLELLVLLRVEKLAVGVEYSESGNALLDGDLVLLGDVYVTVEAADVDVDHDEVFVEELRVGGLMEVDVEDLAVAAPVTTEVEDDALIVAACLLEGVCNIDLRVGGVGVEVLLEDGSRDRLLGDIGGFRSGGLVLFASSDRAGGCECESGESEGCGADVVAQGPGDFS